MANSIAPHSPGEPDGDSRKNRRNLLIAVLVVFLVRLLLILFFAPHDATPSGDTMVYHQVSMDLSRSSQAWVQPGSEFGYRSPLYFVFLAGVYHVTPQPDYRIGQFATFPFGVLTCLILYGLAYNLGGRRVAWAAFWIRGLLPPFVIADTFVMTEPLFSAFLAAAVFVLVGKPSAPTWKQSILLGILVGCCLLTKEISKLYPVIFGAGLWLRSGSIRQKTVNVSIFCFCLLISISPWMWRNKVVWDHAFPLAYTSGANLHIGNNPKATGIWVDLSEEIPDDIVFGTPETSRWHTEQAITYVRAHPGRFLFMGLKKVAWYLFPSFQRDYLVSIYDGPGWLLTVFSLFSGAASALFLLVGIAGFVLKKPDRYWTLSAVLLAYGLMLTFAAYGYPRYRDPSDHILLFFAASLVADRRTVWLELKSGLGILRKKTWILGVALLYLLANWIWVVLVKL